MLFQTLPLQSWVPAPIHALLPLSPQLWDFSSSYLSAELQPEVNISQPQQSKTDTCKDSTEELISYQNWVINLQSQHRWWCRSFNKLWKQSHPFLQARQHLQEKFPKWSNTGCSSMQVLPRNLWDSRTWRLSLKTRDFQTVDSGKVTIWDPAITQIGLHCTLKGLFFSFSKTLIISSFRTQKALSWKRMIESLKRVWQFTRSVGRKSQDNLIVVFFIRLCRKCVLLYLYFKHWMSSFSVLKGSVWELPRLKYCKEEKKAANSKPQKFSIYQGCSVWKIRQRSTKLYPVEQLSSNLSILKITRGKLPYNFWWRIHRKSLWTSSILPNGKKKKKKVNSQKFWHVNHLNRQWQEQGIKKSILELDMIWFSLHLKSLQTSDIWPLCRRVMCRGGGG